MPSSPSAGPFGSSNSSSPLICIYFVPHTARCFEVARRRLCNFAYLDGGTSHGALFRRAFACCEARCDWCAAVYRPVPCAVAARAVVNSCSLLSGAVVGCIVHDGVPCLGMIPLMCVLKNSPMRGHRHPHIRFAFIVGECSHLASIRASATFQKKELARAGILCLVQNRFLAPAANEARIPTRG